MRRAAGQDDLADAERAGLVLVVLQRGHELAREGLNRPPHCVPRLLRLLVGQAFRDHLVGERERALHAVDLGRRSVEGARDRDVERRTAPFEYARELAHAAIGYRERRAVVADRDGDERRRRVAADAVLRGLQHAQQSERLEVDPDQRDARLLARVQVAVDQLAVRDDEQDPLRRLPLLVGALAEHVIVEHGLVNRDRQGLLRTKADRVRQLLLVVDTGNLERADADAVVGDTEAHAFLRKAVCREELLQSRGERIWIAQLAADDDSGLERRARDLQQLGGAVVGHTRSGELRSTDLQAGDALRAAAAARCFDLRLLRLALLRGLRLLRRLLFLRLWLFRRALHLRLLLAADLLLPEPNLLVRLGVVGRSRIRRHRCALGLRLLLASDLFLPERNLLLGLRLVERRQLVRGDRRMYARRRFGDCRFRLGRDDLGRLFREGCGLFRRRLTPERDGARPRLLRRLGLLRDLGDNLRLLLLLLPSEADLFLPDGRLLLGPLGLGRRLLLALAPEGDLLLPDRLVGHH